MERRRRESMRAPAPTSATPLTTIIHRPAFGSASPVRGRAAGEGAAAGRGAWAGAAAGEAAAAGFAAAGAWAGAAGFAAGDGAAAAGAAGLAAGDGCAAGAAAAAAVIFPHATYTETSCGDLCTLMACGARRMSAMDAATVVSDLLLVTEVNGKTTAPTVGHAPA